MIKFRTVDHKGESQYEGQLDVLEDITNSHIPIGGIIAFEIAPGRWLSITISEWGSFHILDHGPAGNTGNVPIREA